MFHFFANFWVTKLELFSGKTRQSVENCLNPELFMVSVLENGFKSTLREKMIALRVQIWHFSLFHKFLSDKVEIVSGKVRQNIQNCLNLMFVTVSFLENECFDCLNIAIFSFLHIFETIFWESEEKPSWPFKSIVGYRKHFRKWF